MSVVFARAWVLLAALLIAAGWILSALSALTKAGYAAAFALVAFALGKTLAPALRSRVRGLPARRFRRWLPLGFALVAVLAAAGGLLHAPNNFDALAYRIPRTLHWLAEHHWHWIDSNYVRLNVRGQGTEWMMAPLLLFTHTDRAVWLLNFLPFLALPGLVFSVFTRAGISPRVAWHWMWLLPCGYGVAGQAGGSANDLPGVFFALASIDFALRARTSGRVADVWLSALAAAVLSAVKLSNTPLGLVWLAAVWPAFRLAGRRPLTTAAVACLAALVSFLPGVMLNAKRCGDWTGAAAELPDTKLPRPAGLVFAANAIDFVGVNLAPPVFPWARRWNAWAAAHLPARFFEPVRVVFGPSFVPTDLPELQEEDWAGLGCGLTLLLAASAATAGRPGRARRRVGERVLGLAPWSALAVLLWMMPVTSIPRMALPYYPLLALAALAGANGPRVVRRRWWRVLAGFAVASCALMLVLTPSRPLWPARAALGALKQRTASPLIARAFDVYETYARRADVLAPVRALLPAEVKRFALVTHNDIETSLWRPFGAREFIHVIPGTSRGEIERRGIDVVVMNLGVVSAFTPRPGEWLASLGGTTLGEVEVRATASGAPFRWRVVRLSPPER